jgi:hypothetical protein
MSEIKANAYYEEWSAEQIKYLSTIQIEALRLAWIHNRMYAIITDKSDKLRRISRLILLISGIITLLVISIDNDIWKLIGGIIAGIINIAGTVFFKPLEDKISGKEGESHRLIAISHVNICDTIESMKNSPTQSFKSFVQLMKLSIKSNKENAINLPIDEIVYREWKDLCEVKKIKQYDTFDKVKEIAEFLEATPEPKHKARPSIPDYTNADDFIDVNSLPSPTPPTVTATTNATVAPPMPTAPMSPIKISPQPSSPIRQIGTMRGYDPKKIDYQLERLKSMSDIS